LIVYKKGREYILVWEPGGGCVKARNGRNCH